MKLTPEQSETRVQELTAQLETQLDTTLADIRARLNAPAPLCLPNCHICDGEGWLLGGEVQGQKTRCWRCKGAGRFDKRTCACPAELRTHSGWLYQERPDSARLDPPLEIVRCLACWRAYRADGVAYDEQAGIDAWNARRQELMALAAGLFMEEQA